MIYLKITIIDLYCASNRGDAAILIGTIEAIKERIPAAEILVLSSFPDTVIDICKIQSLKVPVYVNGKYAGRILNKLYSKRIMPPNGTFKMLRLSIWGFLKKKDIKANWILKANDVKIASAMYESDLIIGCGGGYINDNYKPAIVGRLFNIWFSKFLQRPVVLYSQSIGPFNTPFYSNLAKSVLKRADLITLRDNKSKNILDQLEVNRPPIYVTADAAFGLSPDSQETGRQLLLNEGFNARSDYLKVSISVREWGHYDKDNSQSHMNYIRSMAEIADYLIETKNADIIFASTCTDFGGYHHDDRITAQEVINEMKYDAKILSGEYSPQQLSSIYGCMDFHIGTRMHSNILSMLSVTPVIAIEYEFKTGEMMHFFELDDYVLNINDINIDVFKTKIDDLLNNEVEIKKLISTKIIELEKKAMLSAELAVDLCC